MFPLYKNISIQQNKRRNCFKEVIMEDTLDLLELYNYSFYVKHKMKEHYMKIKIQEILKGFFL